MKLTFESEILRATQNGIRVEIRNIIGEKIIPYDFL